MLALTLTASEVLGEKAGFGGAAGDLQLRSTQADELAALCRGWSVSALLMSPQVLCHSCVMGTLSHQTDLTWLRFMPTEMCIWGIHRTGSSWRLSAERVALPGKQ